MKEVCSIISKNIIPCLYRLEQEGGEEMTPLRQLARFVVNFQLKDVPPKVVKAAKYCVLDSIGAALGAVNEEELSFICREWKTWTKSSSPYQARVWGCNYKLDVFQALFLNGMMGHALELDDVHTGSKSHIGAVVVETAWTLGEAIHTDGKTFLEAVVVGYEIMARVGLSMDVISNRKRGWHGTGVIGTFGAAAAAGHLLRLTEEQMVWAFGMAGTQSSGLWAFLEEGSTCKKLHPARASVNGMTAALLAKMGMTGPEHILEAKDGGLYRAVSDSFSMEKLTKDLGRTYEILAIDKKPYPCCRTTHHAIDAALALRSEIDWERIERIVVETYEVGVLQCGSLDYPHSPVEAKFSIPYTVAAALVRGRVSLSEFTNEAVEDEQIKALAQKVSVVADPLFSGRYPKRWGCRIRITMEDKSQIEKQIDNMSGSWACPLTKEQEIGKFKGLAEKVICEEDMERIVETILTMENAEQIPEI